MTAAPARSKRKGEETRSRLVAAARRTVHEHGIEHSTLAQIAETAQVPLGNVYYYYKTKDDLLQAVVENYDSDYTMLRAMMARHESPRERLKALLATLLMAKDRIALYGCPIGSLCSELGKREPDELSTASGIVLDKLVMVAEEQFAAMGLDDPRSLAITLIAAYEGAALLSHALHDPQILVDHATRLEHWIDQLDITTSPR
jgi:TetR/AcrR family transcriptional repressor of nem operon